MATATLEQDRWIFSPHAFAASQVDRKANVLRDVSILTGNSEVAGHGVYLDDKSLAGAMRLLMGRSLPAYLTHEDALSGDRLTKEIGLWSGFYLDGDKLRARQFRFFPSFAKDETAAMGRLMDLAEHMPEEFGVSIVHAYDVVWVFDDGSEMPAQRGERPPEGAMRPLPSVRFRQINSADFVKEPAANPAGLYAESLDEKAKDKMPSETLQKELDAAKAEFATLKAASDKAATDSENLKAAYAKDRAAFEKQVNELTTERDALKKSLEDEKAAFAKKEADAQAAFDKQLGETKAALKQAERMSAFKLGVPPPDFVLDDKTSITTENVWAAYSSIKDAGERTAFYRKHRDTFLKAGRKPGAA